MVGRQNNNKADPLGLNSGFANPDPRFDEWKPSEEYVPKAGNRKDSRFRPKNMLTATSRRPRQMENMASKARTTPSVTDSGHKTPVATKLDGNGSWADWGVNVSGASRYLQDYEEEKAKNDKADIDNTLASKPVPLDIKGMNQVLAERAKAASTSAAAAYANGTSPRAALFDIEAPTPADVEPYRKKSTTADNIISVKDQVPKPNTLGARLDVQALIPSLTQPGLDERLVQCHIEDRCPSTVTLVNGEEAGGALKIRAEKEERTGQTIDVVRLEQVDSQQPDENMTIWRQEKQLITDRDDEAITQRIIHLINSVSKNTQAPLSVPRGIDKSMAQVSPKQPHSVIQAANLYHRLHKVHELLFKQEFIGLSALNFGKSILFEMDESDFSSHYDEVDSLFLRQWNHRQNQIQQIIEMQNELGLKVDDQRELICKSGIEFEKHYQTVISTHSKLGYGWKLNGEHLLGHTLLSEEYKSLDYLDQDAQIGDVDHSGLFSRLGQE